ncbi:hypothetical protein PJE062_1321 [Pseudovibrio sp. JE062]|nr:hypothetical protein PJE062_1321 [Pseudovibrio sp. JE062]
MVGCEAKLIHFIAKGRMGTFLFTSISHHKTSVTGLLNKPLNRRLLMAHW